MKSIIGLVASAVLSSVVFVSPAGASITYSGYDVESNVRVDYTITTDGTLGTLQRSNILGSTITFTGLATGDNDPHNFASFTATNSLYFVTRDDDYGEIEAESPVSADLTNLYFDFGGRGDLNFGPVNCAGIDSGCNDSDNNPNFATSNVAQQGLVYAFAAANTNEFASAVFHNLDRKDEVEVKSTKELDDFNNDPVNSYLNSGTYTQVTGTNLKLSFAQAIADTPAVPEPATWAMMLAGFGAVGFAMRRRQKARVTLA